MRTLAVLLLMAASPLHAADKQDLVRVSKETTHITEPLDADGFVDYVVAANRQAARGVTPENNYEVVVRRVLGPVDLSGPPRTEYHRMLGVPAPPADGDYFVDFFSGEGSDAKYDPILKQPWTAEDFPKAAKWLKSVAGHLDALVEGSKRPKNYTPYLTGDPDDGQLWPRLIAVLLPSAQQQRAVARGLQARAMFRVGRGDLDGAWRDLQAMHRVARHVASGFTLVELLVGVAIDAIAFNGERQVLESSALTDAQAEAFLTDLKKLTPLPSTAEKVDPGERHVGLDAMQTLARAGLLKLFKTLQLLNDLSDAGDLPEFAVGLVPVAAEPEAKPFGPDWNESMVVVNAWYDRLVAACREPDFKRRKRMFEEVGEGVKQIRKDVGNPATLLAENPFGPEMEQALGRNIGKLVVALLLPAVSNVRIAEDHANARQDVLRLGFAAEVFRREHGHYPKSLAELAPQFVKEIPVDALTGDPLVYRAEGDGFLLYSLGRNGQDDGGRSYDDRTEKDQEFDDVVVRRSAK